MQRCRTHLCLAAANGRWDRNVRGLSTLAFAAAGAAALAHCDNEQRDSTPDTKVCSVRRGADPKPYSEACLGKTNNACASWCRTRVQQAVAHCSPSNPTQGLLNHLSASVSACRACMCSRARCGGTRSTSMKSASGSCRLRRRCVITSPRVRLPASVCTPAACSAGPSAAHPRLMLMPAPVSTLKVTRVRTDDLLLGTSLRRLPGHCLHVGVRVLLEHQAGRRVHVHEAQRPAGGAGRGVPAGRGRRGAGPLRVAARRTRPAAPEGPPQTGAGSGSGSSLKPPSF